MRDILQSRYLRSYVAHKQLARTSLIGQFKHSIRQSKHAVRQMKHSTRYLSIHSTIQKSIRP